MKKITDEVKQKVIQLKLSGNTYSQISKELGIGKGSVSNICKELGLGKNIIDLTDEKIAECQKLYDELGNIKKVAKITKISYDRLRQVIISKTITPKSSYQCVKIHRRKVKEELVNYKGGKCEVCGYDKCLNALEFHHLNPTQKDFTISNSNIYKNLDKLKKELDKCILVCANCHREIHAGVRSCPTDIIADNEAVENLIF